MVEVFMVVDNFLLALVSAALLFSLIVWKVADYKCSCKRHKPNYKKSATRTPRKPKVSKSRSLQARGMKASGDSSCFSDDEAEDDCEEEAQPPRSSTRLTRERKKRRSSAVNCSVQSIQEMYNVIEYNSSDIGIGNSIISDDEGDSDL